MHNGRNHSSSASDFKLDEIAVGKAPTSFKEK